MWDEFATCVQEWLIELERVCCPPPFVRPWFPLLRIGNTCLDVSGCRRKEGDLTRPLRTAVRNLKTERGGERERGRGRANDEEEREHQHIFA